MMSQQKAQRAIHPYYSHAEQSFAQLPATVEQLQLLKEAFAREGEDFLAIELRTMIERLHEINKLMEEGPQG